MTIEYVRSVGESILLILRLGAEQKAEMQSIIQFHESIPNASKK